MNMFIHKWTCSYANEHVHTQMNIVHYFFMPHVMHLNIQWTFIMRHVRVFLNMQHKKNIIYQFWQVHMKITLSSFTSCLDMQDIYLVRVFFLIMHNSGSSCGSNWMNLHQHVYVGYQSIEWNAVDFSIHRKEYWFDELDKVLTAKDRLNANLRI